MGRSTSRGMLFGAFAGFLVGVAALVSSSGLVAPGVRLTADTPLAPTVVLLPAATASVDEKGGEIANAGAKLRVPEGALRAPETLAVAETSLPAPLPKGFRAASRVLRLTKTNETERFEKPVSVTVPVDARTKLDETVALYWDVEHRIYRTVTVIGRDPVARTVTFETIHFTDFLVTSPDDDDMANPNAPLMAVDTGFRSERDGFAFTNGDYDSSGTCLGMSLLSAWYYETHKNDDPPAPSLRELTGSFNPVAPMADLVGREMALLAQRAAIPNGEYLARASKEALAEAARAGAIPSGVALWDQLRVTGTPQLLVIQGPRGAHAIVVFGYKDGAFQIYDPNYPGETHTMAFDRVRGWGAWTGTMLGSPMDVAPVSFSSYGAEVDFRSVFDRAVTDRGETGRYRTITYDSVRDDDGTLVIRGRATGGLENPAERVYVANLYVGNTIVARGNVEQDGRFTIRAPISQISAAALSEHAAPAVVLGREWSFAGAASVPWTPPAPATEPSKTPGAIGVLETVR